MIELPGTKLPVSPLATAQWVRDLVNHDGPLVSEFRNDSGDTILFSWCDCDDQTNRWVACRVKEIDLIKLATRRAALHKLVTNPADGFVYVVDIDSSFKQRACSIARPSELPDDYVPKEDCLLPDNAADGSDTPYAVLIDGTWDTDELSAFPSKYRSAYLAIYTYGKDRAHGPPRPVAHNFPWKGGSSVVHFYDRLLAQTPATARPKVAALVYASPGFIKWRLEHMVARDLRDAVKDFGQEREAATASAKAAYSLIQDNGLNQPNVKPSDEVNILLGQWLDTLATTMPSLDTKRIRDVHIDNFVCLKILLSYYRRINWLHDLEAKGMAEY